MFVLGVDVGLRHTAVAAIRDGRHLWHGTVDVTGDAEDVGPRYAVLREGLEALLRRGRAAPDLVAIEEPEPGIRKGHAASAILKLYGAFAVVFAECRRLFPSAEVLGVRPQKWKGNLGKGLTARMMRAKYGDLDMTEDEWDALGICNHGYETFRDQNP